MGGGGYRKFGHKGGGGCLLAVVAATGMGVPISIGITGIGSTPDWACPGSETRTSFGRTSLVTSGEGFGVWVGVLCFTPVAIVGFWLFIIPSVKAEGLNCNRAPVWAIGLTIGVANTGCCLPKCFGHHLPFPVHPGHHDERSDWMVEGVASAWLGGGKTG